jgi:deazaflavin-dependent oxidoreductase (nitroreductase family)
MTVITHGADAQATPSADHHDPAETEPWNRTDWTAEGIRHWNNQVIAEFRANSGKVGGAYAGGDLLLLTTTGARSGKPHTVPLAFLVNGDQLIVSSFVENSYPAWYHNLRANPAATIELGTEKFAVTATIPTGNQREALWAWLTQQWPMLIEQQEKATLPLPLVAFQR